MMEGRLTFSISAFYCLFMIAVNPKPSLLSLGPLSIDIKLGK